MIVEKIFSIAILALITLLPLLEIAGRQIFGRGIPGSIAIVQHLTLWITFTGAALAASSGRLLAMATASFLPERFKPRIAVFTSACGAAIAAALALASVELVRAEHGSGDTVARGIPVWIALTIMPAGFAAIAARLIGKAAPDWRGRLLAATGLLATAAFAFAPVSGDSRILFASVAVILVATALGLPIFAALGGVALLFFWKDGVPAASVPVETYRLAASPMLPALPLFTLAGYILAEGGASRRLMRTFGALVGWMPGSVAIVTTLVLAFFTPLTGASGVTILSMGGLMLPLLVKSGYPEKSSMGLVTVSGSIGLLFPPSLPVILYGIYAHTPIDQLFIGALLPGVILVLVVAAWGASQGVLAGATRTKFHVRDAWNAVWESKWELLLPVVVIAGIFGGFATLVEAAALTVLYAIIVECFVYRDLKTGKDLPRISIECATLVGGFLIILGVAMGFTNYLIQAEVPNAALAWVRAHIASRVMFLLALNVFLLIVGALMDIYSAILVVVPLIVPIAVAYGIDPLHLGVIFLANMELGYLMPPMGENLFLASYRFDQPLAKIYSSTMPYIVILASAVLLITYVPYLTLGLVRLMAQ